jgi:exodeoxyribonuclease V alpha subunit
MLIAGDVLREHSDTLGAEQVTEAPQTGPYLYLKPLHNAEVGLARSVLQLLGGHHPLRDTDPDKALTWVESQMTLCFASQQREAIRQAVREKVLVLTGGPGTGKTTIVKAILRIFLAKRLKVGLCAPTGRAAKRLAETTGAEAGTIHRLLEFDSAVGTFRRGKDNPVDFDLLIVDEASMLDVVLANQLLRALPAWACLLLVGDRDQLPSVGPGSVLGDVIRSAKVAVVRLNEVHRQAEASWIIRAAHAVNTGEVPASAPAGQGDFYFIEANEPSAILDKVKLMVKERIPAKFGLRAKQDVQVLAPMNKSELGVVKMNEFLQNELNPGRGNPTDEVTRFGTTFRVGDKVIQIRNSYQRDVFNGDLGMVVRNDPIEQVLSVDFDGKVCDYDHSDLDELQLAYCTSIHKSQGSEYPAVVIVLHTQHYMMLQRNLLYTAITRGRKVVVVIGSSKALYLAVNRCDLTQRFSLLTQRLQEKHETPA